MTDLAITKMVNKLNKFEPQTAVKMLNTSIESGYKGVFEIKEDKQDQFKTLEGIEYP